MTVHNSLLKFFIYKESRQEVTSNQTYLLLYLTIPILLIPLFIAWSDSFKDNVSIRKTYYYTDVCKPLYIAVILGTYTFAIGMDLLLLNKIRLSKEKGSTNSKYYRKSTLRLQSYASAYYIAIILLNFLDVAMKILVILAIPAFDTSITVANLQLRALANLNFNLTVENFRLTSNNAYSFHKHDRNDRNEKKEGLNNLPIRIVIKSNGEV
jgi:hypothetical protein